MTTTLALVDRFRRAAGTASPSPSPAGEREAAVLVLADPEREGVPLLFVRRADHLRFHAGQFGFPGGSREPSDADVVRTALREAAEEVGVDPAAVEVVGALPPRLTRRSDLWLTPVLALQRRPITVRGDGYEVAEWFWLPLASLRTAPYRVEEMGSEDGKPHRVHFFEIEGRTIWGVTGAIIHDLLERLEAG
jgi:8-oxo-dGTP pyrophosphatase MutT (NUDIX family)